jgi:type IV pilus assembly protein PilO
MSGLFKPVITKKDWITVGSIAVGLVVIALLVTLFIYQPQTKEVARLDSEILAQEQELDALRQTAAKKEELEARLREIEQVVARFEAKLPTRKEIPKLFRKFQLAAGDANVIAESIEKLDEVKKPPRIDVPYQFTVSGSYHQIATFINKLEMGERFVKISDVHIGEQKRGVSEAEFKLTTFLFVEEPEGVQPEGVQQ